MDTGASLAVHEGEEEANKQKAVAESWAGKVRRTLVAFVVFDSLLCNEATNGLQIMILQHTRLVVTRLVVT